MFGWNVQSTFESLRHMVVQMILYNHIVAYMISNDDVVISQISIVAT